MSIGKDVLSTNQLMWYGVLHKAVAVCDKMNIGERGRMSNEVCVHREFNNERKRDFVVKTLEFSRKNTRE